MNLTDIIIFLKNVLIRFCISIVFAHSSAPENRIVKILDEHVSFRNGAGSALRRGSRDGVNGCSAQTNTIKEVSMASTFPDIFTMLKKTISLWIDFR